MAAKGGRIANQQQLAPCAGHANAEAADADENEKSDATALGWCENLNRPSKAPCAARHALPRHWQKVGLFTWTGCHCHFRCMPPHFGLCPCVRPHRRASGPLVCERQSVHGPAQIQALVRHRLGERRGWPGVGLLRLTRTMHARLALSPTSWRVPYSACKLIALAMPR